MNQYKVMAQYAPDCAIGTLALTRTQAEAREILRKWERSNGEFPGVKRMKSRPNTVVYYRSGDFFAAAWIE